MKFILLIIFIILLQSSFIKTQESQQTDTNSVSAGQKVETQEIDEEQKEIQQYLDYLFLNYEQDGEEIDIPDQNNGNINQIYKNNNKKQQQNEEKEQYQKLGNRNEYNQTPEEEQILKQFNRLLLNLQISLINQDQYVAQTVYTNINKLFNRVIENPKENIICKRDFQGNLGQILPFNQINVGLFDVGAIVVWCEIHDFQFNSFLKQYVHMQGFTNAGRDVFQKETNTAMNQTFSYFSLRNDIVTIYSFSIYDKDIGDYFKGHEHSSILYYKSSKLQKEIASVKPNIHSCESLKVFKIPIHNFDAGSCPGGNDQQISDLDKDFEQNGSIYEDICQIINNKLQYERVPGLQNYFTRTLSHILLKFILILISLKFSILESGKIIIFQGFFIAQQFYDLYNTQYFFLNGIELLMLSVGLNNCKKIDLFLLFIIEITLALSIFIVELYVPDYLASGLFFYIILILCFLIYQVIFKKNLVYLSSFSTYLKQMQILFSQLILNNISNYLDISLFVFHLLLPVINFQDTEIYMRSFLYLCLQINHFYPGFIYFESDSVHYLIKVLPFVGIIIFVLIIAYITGKKCLNLEIYEQRSILTKFFYSIFAFTISPYFSFTVVAFKSFLPPVVVMKNSKQRNIILNYLYCAGINLVFIYYFSGFFVIYLSFTVVSIFAPISLFRKINMYKFLNFESIFDFRFKLHFSNIVQEYMYYFSLFIQNQEKIKKDEPKITQNTKKDNKNKETKNKSKKLKKQ